MKRILFGLATLSAMTYAEPSTGVHTTTGSNQIDVETRALVDRKSVV